MSGRYKPASVHCTKCGHGTPCHVRTDDVVDDTLDEPVGWKIIAIGSDGSVLCCSPTGRRRRYWFLDNINLAEKFVVEDEIDDGRDIGGRTITGV